MQFQLQYRHVSVLRGTPGLELTESVISSTPLSDEGAIFLWNSLDMSESCNAPVASGLSRIETFTIRGMKEHNCTGSCVAIRNVGRGLGWLSGMKRSVPSAADWRGASGPRFCADRVNINALHTIA